MNKFDRVYLKIIKEDSSDTVGEIGNLTFNKETNKWDCDGSYVVKPEDITDGTLNKPFGVINGVFHCMGLQELKTCNNFPTKVTGNLDIANCDQLEDISGLKDCQILGQLQMGHNGNFGIDDFIEVIKPQTRIWDYVNMDADQYDEQLDMYYDQNHGKYWNWKEGIWDDGYRGQPDVY